MVGFGNLLELKRGKEETENWGKLVVNEGVICEDEMSKSQKQVPLDANGLRKND